MSASRLAMPLRWPPARRLPRLLPWRIRLACNVLLSQVGWFACVLGAAHGRPQLGAAIGFALVAAHIAAADRPAQALRLAAVVTAAGFAFDSALAAAGVVVYGGAPAWHAPLWIAALWALFSTTLNLSLRRLRGPAIALAALGAVVAPLSWSAGVRLGAAAWPDATRAVLAIALGWALLLPLAVRLARRFDGIDAPSPGARHA